MKLYSKKDNKNLKDHLLNEGLVYRSSHVALGVSGGADSVAMLLYFCSFSKELDLKLTVRHLEHGIRGEESLRDRDFVKNLCEKLGVSFVTKTANVPAFAKDNGLSVEEAARKLRYEFLFEGDEDMVAVAHNFEDNAETFIFNLIRGTGLNGLCGMSEKTEIYGKTLIRPLLTVSREDILKYLADLGQDFCEDSTNSNEAYSRNSIRNTVIPALKVINTKAIENINRAALNLTETKGFVSEKTDEYKSAIREEKISIEALKKAPSYIKKNLIMAWVEENLGSKDVTAHHYEAILSLLNNNAGKKIDLPGGQVIREYEELVIKKESQKAPTNFLPKLQINTEYLKYGKSMQIEFGGKSFTLKKFPLKNMEIPKGQYTKWFDCDKIGNDFFLRGRGEKDYIIINSRSEKKTFNRYCIDEKIPAAKRDEIPLFAVGNHILWAVGYRISEGFKVDDATRTVLEISVKE